MERLKAKRKTIQEGLVVQAPTKSPTSFERSCRGTGKRGAAGDFAVASGADKLSHKQLMHRQVHVHDGETSGGMQCPFQ